MDDMLGPDARKELYKAARAKIETLWNACCDGDLERVKKIIDDGDHDVDGKNRWQTQIDPQGWNRVPLHAAAIRGDLDLARYLLDEGADVDPLTKYGDTPLHFAITKGHAALAALLVERGADPMKENSDDVTARELAAKSGNPDMIKALGPD